MLKRTSILILLSILSQISTNDFCSLPAKQGPCRGYFPYYYYNTNHKQCIQFIYGGCLGNKNNFQTKNECEKLCLGATEVTNGYQEKVTNDQEKVTNDQEQNMDQCKQPVEPGMCRGYFVRYYYNSYRKSCQGFIYGGCMANNNNFKTIDECKKKCEI